MDKIFNPSLLISLGPSSRKALDISKKLLSCMPQHFLDLVEFYDVYDISKMKVEIQDIIDKKLLSAKNLNKLVDLGYKVRNDNLPYVRINVYMLWDVYEKDSSALEVIKTLTEINFGNVDRELHSGAALFIMPIMEREWNFSSEDNIKSIEELKEVIDLISDEQQLLNIDSRVYMLHCVSRDGTRIPKGELEFIAAILTYLNVIPSKEPPLCQFNQRLLMNEGKYKIGSVGIASLTVFRDQLLEDFAAYLGRDVLKFASENEFDFNFNHYKIFSMMRYESQKNNLLQDVGLITDEDGYRLKEEQIMLLELPKDISLYPEYFKKWEEYIENNYLIKIKKVIDNNYKNNNNLFRKALKSDIEEIVTNSGLKQGIKYIEQLRGDLEVQKSSERTVITEDIEGMEKRFRKFINNYPDTAGFIGRLIVLCAFLFYSMNNLLFPYVKTGLRPVFFICFVVVFSIISYIDYFYRRKKLHTLIKKYTDLIFKKSGASINFYAERKVFENNRNIIEHMEGCKEEITKCIQNAEKLHKNISPVETEVGEMGNLITSLLNFEDRKRYYKLFGPNVQRTYKNLVVKLGNYKKIADDDILENVIDFSKEIAEDYVNKDFYEFLSFKYEKNVNKEVSDWVDRAIIKSKYLLQYINNDLLEEHSLFIASPEVYNLSRDIVYGKLNNFQVSILDGEDIYTNCISLIRLCFGIDFNRISAVRNLKRGENNV